MSKHNAAWRRSNRAILCFMVLAGIAGCRAAATEPEAVDEVRRSIVCAPAGITATSADTVSVAPDGSCPVGFDTMIWV